jgi:hypothetical protein
MLHEKARTHITGLANDELAEYIRGGTDLYQEEAIRFAREEFARRNLSPEVVRELETEAIHRVAFRTLTNQEMASRPLGAFGKIAAFMAGFLSPGGITVIILFIVSNGFKSRGEEGKAAEMWKCFRIGLLCWVVPLISIVVIGGMIQLVTNR